MPWRVCRCGTEESAPIRVAHAAHTAATDKSLNYNILLFIYSYLQSEGLSFIVTAPACPPLLSVFRVW